ncbi:methyltransferase, FxLD system [Actinoplanes sp. NPDC051346]|uniref:methyltransferase, FxLD system n=1 Tax=Actinoplanes sp. NPDC051346 TaxID=3155048 RepID=UPI0034238481
MIETARLRPGARVLEIGSGGYNAALLAEVVGPDGEVTSIDIDADVVNAARAALTRAGYPQVRVAHADAEDGFPDAAPYDAIIVTVEAADIPPAFGAQLAPDGALVVPLRMRGNTRCLTLTRRDDHWEATAAILCGFVAMQGAGSHPARRIPLRGDDIAITVDEPTAVALDTDAYAEAFAQPRVQAWAPVFVAAQEPFESLHLWLASQPHPYGLLAVDRDLTPGLLDPQNRVACPTLLATDSLAYLALRKLDENRWQFGAHGVGTAGNALAATMVDMITAWDRDHRHGPGPRITVHPTPPQPPPAVGTRLLVERRHTTIAVTWPDLATPR